MAARSRSKSSEWGARRKSFRFAFGNSRPMTGVTSNDSNASSAPLSLMGVLSRPLRVILLSSVIGMIGVVVSVREGAMMGFV